MSKKGEERKNPLPKCWLMYSKAESGEPAWIASISEGRHIFWRHGNDAYTKQMSPGDIVLFYLAGYGNEPSKIFGAGILSCIREPFIIDERRYHRIPCLLVQDLREQPILWHELQSISGDIDIPDSFQQGGINQLNDDAFGLVSKFLPKFPTDSKVVKSLVLKSSLWSEIQSQSGYIVLKQHLGSVDLS